MLRFVNKRFVLFAYALSGACSLVYQLIWYHYFIDHFGATGTTYLVVLCTFIGGLGLGAIASRRVTGWLARVTRFQGLRLYGLIELLIAVLVVLLIGLTRVPIVHWVGIFPYTSVTSESLTLNVPDAPYQALKIGQALLAIGLPCFLMGLTYPYICSLFTHAQRFPSQLYALNTLGACLAILAAEFLGFPTIGYFLVMLMALAVNLLIALLFFASTPSSGPKLDDTSAPKDVSPTSDYPAVLSGFLCGGLEALAFIFIKLTYFGAKSIFALLSFHAIAGIWVASTMVHRFKPRPRLLILYSWLALAWCVALWFVEPDLGYSFVMWWAEHLLGMSPYVKGAIVTFVYTAFYISLPYACLSLLLPALCDQKQANGENLSKTYGFNTMAFLAGVLVFGWLLQYVHPFYAARIFALMAAAGILLLSFQKWGKTLTVRTIAIPVIMLGAGFALTPSSLSMRLIISATAETVPVMFESTPQHLFWVKAGPDGRPIFLMFDNHSMSAVDGQAQRYMRLMAHFPLLLHQRPRNALLICYGVGSTADSIRQHSTIEQVDVLDLNPSVFRLSRAFEGVNHNVLKDEKIALIVDDGRQFLKLTTNQYDLVTLEPPPPLKQGVSRLYSREFYRDVLGRLAPGGFVSQWLPEEWLTQKSVDLIVRTFVDAFPNAFCFVGAGRNLILVGSNTPILLDHLPDHLAFERRVREDMRRFGIDGVSSLLAAIIDTPETLRSKWANGSIIRDGFVSLDNILISPVQYFGPRQEFSRYKCNLRAETAAVRSWIAGQSPDLGRAYDLYWESMQTQQMAKAIMPACYLSVTNSPGGGMVFQ